MRALLWCVATARLFQPLPLYRPAVPAPALDARAQVAMQFGFGNKQQQLPKGWKRVPSQSRPGQFSFMEIKTGKRYDKLPGQSFYDDERDTVSKPLWNFRQAEKQSEQSNYRSVEEAAGYGENGKDLALVGLAPYLAAVPALLFFLSYVFGGGGSGPYGGTGNF